MNSMALEIQLHMLDCSGLVWPILKLQLNLYPPVKVAISAEMEVHNGSINHLSQSQNSNFQNQHFLQKSTIFAANIDFT